MEIGKLIHASVLQSANVLISSLFTSWHWRVECLCTVDLDSSAQIIDMLSVLFLVLFALACGAVSSARERGGVTSGLQMVKQLVSWGELFVTGHTAEDYFLLELDGRICFLIIKGWTHFIMFSRFCDAPYSLISDKKIKPSWTVQTSGSSSAPVFDLTFFGFSLTPLFFPFCFPELLWEQSTIGNSNTNLLLNLNTATFACMKLKNYLLMYKSERKIIPNGTPEGHSWVSIMDKMSLGTLYKM